MAASEKIAITTQIEEIIALHPVVIFSKTTCAFCTQAKLGISKFPVVELDNMDSEVAGYIQDHLETITGARTMPRVFVGRRCIGGGTQTASLAKSGELEELANKAIAKHKQDLSGKGEFALAKSDDDWKAALDPVAYRMLRQRGTEPPGSHEYDQFYPKRGHFACGACSFPLYSATSKFKSSCGWPVFSKCYHSKESGCHIGTRSDGSGSLEIVCPQCGSHLGHVFFDAHSKENPSGERH